jgi:hypothetical protein
VSVSRNNSLWIAKGETYRTRLLVGLTLFLIVTLLAACSGLPLPDPSEPTLNRASVIGTWTDRDGSSITFDANQHITVHRLDLRDQTNGENKSCGFVTGSGSWQFVSEGGRTESRSSLIEVDLASPMDEVCGLQELSADNTNSAVGLCVFADPDDPCGSSGPEYFRSKAK